MKDLIFAAAVGGAVYLIYKKYIAKPTANTGTGTGLVTPVDNSTLPYDDPSQEFPWIFGIGN